MKASTRNCGSYGHPEFSVICDDASVYESRLGWLLGWLETEVSKGKRFLPEQTVQVGWSLLKVKEREDGTLSLFEPDYKSVPANFVDNVSTTLLHLLLQKIVNESLGLENEMVLSPMQHSTVICTDFGITKGLILSRVSPDKFDSGWFCGCDNISHDHQSAENLRRVSLYEAATLLDERIIPYLALPPGIWASFGDSTPRFSLNDKELSIKPDSYLHKKFVAR